MESFRVPHHALLFFILTFITGPVSASDITYVQFNDPVNHHCHEECLGVVKWTLSSNPDYVVAECDQTSCRSKEGFKMSHDQYLKAEPILYIPAADYSKRGLYTCWCDDREINDMELIIVYLSSSIRRNPGEDLLLDLHVTDRVKVIHVGKDSTDPHGEEICTVDRSSLNCTAEYTPRTSLNDTVLTLRGVNLTDEGVYTIQDMDNNDLHVYAVSVGGTESAISTVYARVNQAAVLPCVHKCSGLAKWTLLGKRDTVAQCDQTNICRSKNGFRIFYNRRLKKNLNLTITRADYSMRGLYTCQCDGRDLKNVYLIIDPQIVEFITNLGNDLRLKLFVSERVKVIFKGKYSADPHGKEICTVDRDSLHCTAEYTPRTSLTNKVLTLRGIKTTDVGLYSIQDTKNNNLQICLLSITGSHSPTVKATFSQAAALPCKKTCPGLAKWTLFDKPDDVLAECNQTSCRSVKEGFNMSHDQYLKGDLTLTVAAADYSMRKSYTCQCVGREHVHHVELRIEPLKSSIQINSGEDLLLDLPDVFKRVIYKGANSTTTRGKEICTTHSSGLRCTAEYTPRTSLNNTVLTLRGVKPTDWGVYTIQDSINNDLHIYTVSVKAIRSSVQINSGENLQLYLYGSERVKVIYRRKDSFWNPERPFDVEICTVDRSSLNCTAEYTLRTSLTNTVLTLRGVKSSDEGDYIFRDIENNEHLQTYTVSVRDHTVWRSVLIPVVLLLLVAVVVIILYKRKRLECCQEDERNSSEAGEHNSKGTTAMTALPENQQMLRQSEN
ncbi:uncharacterized protein LOC128523357 [Clarias gariepinus]|uniref:uncharacterized protein LOC128523357 n=1 Tax=Clarias gariepinus TaxID=13013 RepID=UPI00234CA1AD|nr:uncharacterized protein LOC128523357 [Clarias gariepinus]XP_053351651.1 uncharacterized protein LOC128523357 [Clarias gariepinus]XP_053351652.1 uncharacterized protein LOC128523357 [Clarias gariepinus]XP_053351653.1 uncharacterized protein LOC128523357 [Clarias gariepinus]XP_053351654.1 uncharacterized protein LOC128523357 [Clarias gariepinus]XP_053351655.1 uncharacterized protein LOC128523357 [Clarias gariepinus]XP_053351656.1 uncharacterized protein LOC128523357 [Clarias gariepinus]